MFVRSVFGTVFAILAGTSASAATTYEVNAVKRGCYNGDVDVCTGSGTPSGIFYTGENDGGGFESENFRSYFGFDLSGLGGTVISGEIYIEINPQFGYFSDDPSESIAFYPISDDSLNQLLNGTFDAGTGFYSDLGTGINLGGPTVTPADVAAGSITYAMGAQWINALNTNLGGDFGFGGRLFTTTINGDREGLFGGSGTGNDAFTLRITTDEIPPVPLPAGLPMLLVGLAGFGVLRGTRARYRMP